MFMQPGTIDISLHSLGSSMVGHSGECSRAWPGNHGGGGEGGHYLGMMVLYVGVMVDTTD